MFAMTLGLHFGEPDFWKILREWPPSLFNYWNARYLLEPWDAANQKALIDAKYEPPADMFRTGKFVSDEEVEALLKRSHR